MEGCALCKQPLEGAIVKLRKKGSDSINFASISRGDDINTVEGQVVHQECRRNYINPHRIASALHSPPDKDVNTQARTLRSSGDAFNFRTDCLFCGQRDQKDWKTGNSSMIPVRTEIQFQDTIRTICHRRKDEWGLKVLSRLEYAGDCFAADAMYHRTCSANFRTLKRIPKYATDDSEPVNKLRKLGRPEDVNRTNAFMKVVEYFKTNDAEQMTISELVSKMKCYTDDPPYSIPYMKKKLLEYFGQKIVIAEVNGKSDVITLNETAFSILHDFYALPKEQDQEKEKLRIVAIAAKLLRQDIKSVTVDDDDTYPCIEDLTSVEKNLAFLPNALLLMLKKLFGGTNTDVKIASIGQAIMQACRPRHFLPPLQIGLGIQMQHHFASRFLIDTLHKHGFSSSYTEVKNFHRSAAATNGTDIKGYKEGDMLQFIADNVDHNVRTLDGFNTFHGMGIVAASTPGRKAYTRVPRATATSDMLEIGKIGVHFYKSEWNGLSTIAYEKLSNADAAMDPTSNLDILWRVSWPLKNPRPAWSGFMQTVHATGQQPGPSSITFLPMIDMSSSDPSCIYSTLKFVCKQSAKYNVTAVITFDQPLWWKAQSIIASSQLDKELQAIVLRLGAFHTEMSFLGCVGHIMAGSGLREVFETIYSPNAVSHMLTGKAISRSLRAHFITDTALHAILMASIFEQTRRVENEPKIRDDSHTDDSLTLRDRDRGGEVTVGPARTEKDRPRDVQDNELKQIATIFDKLMDGQMAPDQANKEEVLMRVNEKLSLHKQSLQGKTSALWFLYMDMIELLRRFIKAERTGNWNLHLQTLTDMLPYFAASGHNLYTKSARLYLQNMNKLKVTHLDVYTSFQQGGHVVRRSDRFWAGLSSDLIIEQVLMRTLKTNGGLTRGTGMDEEQRVVWLMAMPVCAAVNAAMQEYSNISFSTSEQHKDVTKARLNRDGKDLETVSSYLQDRNPFSGDTLLRNIASGEIGDESVNAHRAVEIGHKILDAMTGKTILEFSFKKKDQVSTLATKASPNVDGDVVQIDPHLLFQRLITTAEHVDENLSTIFTYELSNVPSALFESSGLPLQANKPALADALWTLLKHPEWPTPAAESQLQFVLDGGSLLHHMVWPRGATYTEILELYVKYVSKKYDHVTVVFDGYGHGPSTKDSTHVRRAGVIGAQVNFSEDMIVCTGKEAFLSNKSNKQRFIQMLSDKLERNGCTIKHAKGDADLLIVQTAVEYSQNQVTAVVGEDTDLLILLCYHVDEQFHDVYFLPEHKATSKKKTRVWKMKDVKKMLGPEICKHILFTHAVLGCDTTSRVFGIGKGAALAKLSVDNRFKIQAEVFHKISTQQEISQAGEQAMVLLYNGQYGSTLDSLRHSRFREKVSTSHTSVEPRQLPPTSAANTFHSLRVYLQVQTWIGKRSDMKEQDWGWELKKERLFPIRTHLEAAPAWLLRVIRCNCKSGCASAKCTCKKHGMECSPACGDCRGQSCTNSPAIDFGDDHDI